MIPQNVHRKYPSQTTDRRLGPAIPNPSKVAFLWRFRSRVLFLSLSLTPRLRPICLGWPCQELLHLKTQCHGVHKPLPHNKVVILWGGTWRWKSWLTNQSTYGQWLWVMTERMRPPEQAAERSFLCRVVGITHIQKDMGVELLFLQVDKSQLRWFRHLIRIPLGYLPVEVVCPTGRTDYLCPTGRRTRGRLRTCWRQ